MHSMRPRSICRAHNTFSPSITLWQHFVAPNQHLPRTLFTTEAAQTRDSDDVGSSEKEPAAEFDFTLIRKTILPKAPVRRIRTAHSNFEINPKLHPNFRDKRDTIAQINGQKDKKDTRPYRGENGQDVEKLLLRAYAAYDTSQDYEGVVVQPMRSPPVQDSKYPWAIQNRGNIETGEER